MRSHPPASSCTPRSSLPIVPPDAPPLEERLAKLTIPGKLHEVSPSGHVRCFACAHHCAIQEGRAGACGVRFVRDQQLRVPFGYVARAYVRSVEINTIFHVRPGAKSLTFGMYGCDLRCPYCHNAHLSQALRDPLQPEAPREVQAKELIDEAVAAGCEVVCAAYNEPMISAEWNYAVFEEARSRGLLTALISDGNTTREALAFMRPVTDVYRIDLKGYRKEHYRALGGRIEPVLDAISEARAQGYWVEVVTLVVPGFNDEELGLRSIAKYLARIDTNIPWHLNAAFPRYKHQLPVTPGMLLASAAGTAFAQGLRYVYVSNIPDDISELSHTRCPTCMKTLVERHDFHTRSVQLEAGACPDCKTPIPGLWGDTHVALQNTDDSNGELP